MAGVIDNISAGVGVLSLTRPMHMKIDMFSYAFVIIGIVGIINKHKFKSWVKVHLLS